jgi:YfiR/HmsC-like
MMRSGRGEGLASLLWLAGLALLALPALCAQARDERAVKAAYTFNLIKFVEFPTERRPLLLCVLGDPGMGDMMKQMLDGRSTDAGQIWVLPSPAGAALENCSVIYLADANPNAVRRVLERSRGRAVLTIGESDNFAEQGGLIALVKEGDHIQIDVNLEASQRAGIKISSRVLNLAHRVPLAQTAVK